MLYSSISLFWIHGFDHTSIAEKGHVYDDAAGNLSIYWYVRILGSCKSGDLWLLLTRISDILTTVMRFRRGIGYIEKLLTKEFLFVECECVICREWSELMIRTNWFALWSIKARTGYQIYVGNYLCHEIINRGYIILSIQLTFFGLGSLVPRINARLPWLMTKEAIAWLCDSFWTIFLVQSTKNSTRCNCCDAWDPLDSAYKEHIQTYHFCLSATNSMLNFTSVDFPSSHCLR